MSEELQKVDKEWLEDACDELSFDEIFENELEEIKRLSNLVEAKILALQHHRRIEKNAQKS